MSTPAATQRSSMPRWVWAVIVLLAVVTALAVTVATFAVRGRDVLDPPAATTLPKPTLSEGAGTTSPHHQDLVAVGCLGGATNLDAAVLDAQSRAPRTPEGAAAFAATLARWAGQLPPSGQQRKIAAQLLAPEATPQAVRSVSSADREWPGGKTTEFDFSAGRYYIEEFNDSSAVVSFYAEVHGIENATRLPDARVAGTAHLRYYGQKWHLVDTASARSIEDMLTIGSPYVGGC